MTSPLPMPPVRFFGQPEGSTPLKHSALRQSFMVVPEGDAHARLWWMDEQGDPHIIRTTPPPWRRPVTNEQLWAGGRYLLNNTQTSIRLPLMANGEDLELVPDYFPASTWGSGLPALVPSAGWKVDKLPLNGNYHVRVIADTPNLTYRIMVTASAYVLDTLDATFLTFDRLDTLFDDGGAN